MTSPKGLPPVPLEHLPRVARRQTIGNCCVEGASTHSDCRRSVFYLWASTRDDALELGEALIIDLFYEADLAKANYRQAQQRDLEKAVLLLRDLAAI